MGRGEGLFEAMGEGLARGRTVDEIAVELEERFGETCATFVLDCTGFTRVVSVTHSSPASPYTPVVLISTSFFGNMRCSDNDVIKRRLR